MRVMVVEVGGDVITRCQIGCLPPAAAFAAWLESQGHTVRMYEAEPFIVDLPERARIESLLRDYSAAQREALLARPVRRLHA